MNPLVALADHGQSIWLDYIRRGMTRSGELARMVAADGLRGMTSNPSIFQQAITGSDDYADVLEAAVGDAQLDARTLYERLAIEDIREAADVLRAIYDGSEGRDGFVSLECSPSLATDAEGTVEEARRYWRAVDRPNLMIKVPGTDDGVVAIERLLTEGINVNVTLLFSCDAYAKVAEAYLRALEARVARGENVATIASVASFFVSRIDTEVDAVLDSLAAASRSPTGYGDLHRCGGPLSHVGGLYSQGGYTQPFAGPAERFEALRGKAAVANAKLAHADVYSKLFAGPRWQTLADFGARPQRLLWASTGTKNKAYSDVLYVDELIGRDTVNTAPLATIAAFRDHGKVADTLVGGVDEARATMKALADCGISFASVTDKLLERGLELFAEAMDGLLASIAELQRKARGSRLDRMSFRLPAALHDTCGQALAEWDRAEKTQRLWQRDASLWTGSDEGAWMAWLDIVERQRGDLARFDAFAKDVAAAGFREVVLLGMGGSSLFPEVLARTWSPKKGQPRLRILDSTVPDQVARVTASLDPKTTLFVVASKSGTTLEPKVLLQHFWAHAQATLGDDAGKHFVAITDPGSQLEAQARQQGFRAIFHGVPQIGGRYSALSNFGMIPAAAMGLPVGELLAEAALMVEATRPGRTAEETAGVRLGIVLGVAARLGRDKLTVIASPAIASFGAWLEQLVAESTGKQGKAIIPVDGERPAAPEKYGHDRVFAYLRVRSTPDLAQDRAVAALAAAGQPVVTIELDDRDSLPQEVFRWEIATAVAGSVLAIDPFDQPDVEASKLQTRAMTKAYEETGALPAESSRSSMPGLSIFTDDANASALGKPGDLTAWMRAHLDRIDTGDYFALLAYVDGNDEHAKILGRMRHLVRDRKQVATCVGFGPRFLHSTGQAYKGGPNTGVFLQITEGGGKDVPIPGSKYGFAVVVAAQARGDFAVLAERQRRLLRVHIGGDVRVGLLELERAIAAALR